MQTAGELKDQAAECFKRGEYRAAIDLYTRADQLSEDSKFKAVVNNNIAVCYNQLLQPGLAEPFSSKSIQLDKSYVKAYLTRISSSEKQQKFQNCLKDYEQLLKIEDRVQWRKSYLEMKAKAQADLQKKKAQVMGGLKDMANGVLGWFNMSLDNFKVEQNQGGSYNISFKQKKRLVSFTIAALNGGFFGLIYSLNQSLVLRISKEPKTPFLFSKNILGFSGTFVLAKFYLEYVEREQLDPTKSIIGLIAVASLADFAFRFIRKK